MAKYYTVYEVLEAVGAKTKLQKWHFLRLLSKYDLIGEINLNSGMSIERLDTVLQELEKRGKTPKYITFRKS